MRILSTLIEQFRPLFDDGRLLSRFRPLLESVGQLVFSSDSVTVHPPYCRDPIHVQRMMAIAFLALLPCVVAGTYFFGLRVPAVLAVCCATACVTEVVCAILFKQRISDGFLVTGLLFGLMLPSAIPFWVATVGCAAGIIGGKIVCLLVGRPLFHPASAGWLILALAFPLWMGTCWTEAGKGLTGRLLQYATSTTPDAVCEATPLMHAKEGRFEDTSHLVLGSVPGSSGETSGPMVLFGGLFLVITRVANWRTVAAILGSAVVVQVALHGLDPGRYGSAEWHLFAGGLLFGAFFVAADPLTSPTTAGGKLVYGIFIGSTTILIRNFSPFPEGILYAILLGNLAAGVLDRFFLELHRRSLRRIEIVTYSTRQSLANGSTESVGHRRG
jgi:RnfABCDGE-type electron transport complex D subunit